ncbi:hypothetical protein EAF04_003616 [Stromatinia cepivora]|nr:hypothetical protein EAF04_003616 [Stromatinia cepivora]
MSCSASPTFQVLARDDHREHIFTRQCPSPLDLRTLIMNQYAYSALDRSGLQQSEAHRTAHQLREKRRDPRYSNAEQQLQSASRVPTPLNIVRPLNVALKATAVDMPQIYQETDVINTGRRECLDVCCFACCILTWAKPCGFQGGYPKSGQHSDPGAPITSPSAHSQHDVQQSPILSSQPQRGGPNAGICSSINGLPTSRMALLTFPICSLSSRRRRKPHQQPCLHQLAGAVLCVLGYTIAGRVS